MGDEEEATVRTCKAYRLAINDLAQQYRGRIVDSQGDNILAELCSFIDAVNCAVASQFFQFRTHYKTFTNREILLQPDQLSACPQN